MLVISGLPGPMQRPRLRVYAGNATATAPPLLTLKFVKQHRLGFRHTPPSGPSTAVLLEERRCSGENTSSAGLVAAPAEPAIEGADSIRHGGSSNGSGHTSADELRHLQRGVDFATAQSQEDAGDFENWRWQQQQGQAQRQWERDQRRNPREQRQQQRWQQHGQPRQPRRQRASSASPASAVADGHTSFAEWSAYCRLHASSPFLPHWVQAAGGLQQLVDSVRGPQQAQQAWELVALLASRPLPAHTAHVVAHTAVQLVNLSLSKGDYSILHALLAQRLRPFAFGRRSLESLLRAVLAADVEPGELQAVIRLAPGGSLGARAFFALVRSFEARGRAAEALRCFQQMQVLGLRLSPAMEETFQRLRDGRAPASRHALAAHR